jgi:two-component system OmpR family response regulator
MRVLIVEDEADLLAAIARSLRAEGYAVDEAGDGAEGLHRALSTEYDLVVLDLMLPKISGLHLLRELRKSRKTPVLILTARGHANDRVAGLDAGADDYLIKPFNLAELHARARALIRRAAGQASATLALAEFTVDTARRVVIREGEVVPLTPREFALMELFALNRGKVVSRTQVYEHLFQEDDDTLSNVVDVHVANLRRKLGKDLITTRRGEGYQVDG